MLRHICPGHLLMPAWHHPSICRQFLSHMQLFSFCSSTYWCGARLDPCHCTQLPFSNCWLRKVVSRLYRYGEGSTPPQDGTGTRLHQWQKGQGPAAKYNI